MSVSGQFFQHQASLCASSAAGSKLDNQRDTYLRAQAAWQALADREFGLKAARAEREAEKAAVEAGLIEAEPVKAGSADSVPAGTATGSDAG